MHFEVWWYFSHPGQGCFVLCLFLFSSFHQTLLCLMMEVIFRNTRDLVHGQTHAKNVRKPGHQGLIFFSSGLSVSSSQCWPSGHSVCWKKESLKQSVSLVCLVEKTDAKPLLYYNAIFFFFLTHSLFCPWVLPSFLTYQHAIFLNCAVCFWILLQFVNVSLN